MQRSQNLLYSFWSAFSKLPHKSIVGSSSETFFGSFTPLVNRCTNLKNRLNFTTQTTKKHEDLNNLSDSEFLKRIALTPKELQEVLQKERDMFYNPKKKYSLHNSII
jgi:hypothetical protein